MSIPIDARCLQCHFNKSVELARTLGDEATALAFAKDLMRSYLEAPDHYCSVMLGPATAALLKKYYDLDPDRFRQEKEDSNRFVLERMEDIRRRVTGAEDPVFAGLQNLQDEELKHHESYPDSRTAFHAAVTALRDILAAL